MARRDDRQQPQIPAHVSGNSTLSLSEAVTGDVSAGADAVEPHAGNNWLPPGRGRNRD